MKERILTQLYGIWKGAPSSEAYLERIKNYKLKIKEEGGDRLTDGEIRQRAGMALQYMLHDYSRFRVETIDSFFQSVMRNLARELELSPNLNIELNNSEVLSDAYPHFSRAGMAPGLHRRAHPRRQTLERIE